MKYFFCKACRSEVGDSPDDKLQRCPNCGHTESDWDLSPSYRITLVSQGRWQDGRDDEAREYMRGFLDADLDTRLKILELSSALWEWEAAYRGLSSATMRKDEEVAKECRRFFLDHGGEALWYKASMAMPPHLRHVASEDFGTNGQYRGTYNPPS